MRLEDVLVRLALTAPGMARCPAHDDRTPSLSVREGPGGTVRLHCFAGCSREAIVRALGLPEAPASYVPPPSDMWEAVHRDAMALARRQPWAQGDIQLLMAGADLHRSMLDLIEQLHRAAEALSPDLPETWDLLARAADLESERRLLEVALDRFGATL